MSNKFELQTRQQKIKYVCALGAECWAIEKEIARSKVHLRLAECARDRLHDEIKMDDLIHFCNTGKYPSE